MKIDGTCTAQSDRRNAIIWSEDRATTFAAERKVERKALKLFQVQIIPFKIIFELIRHMAAAHQNRAIYLKYIGPNGADR